MKPSKSERMQRVPYCDVLAGLARRSPSFDMLPGSELVLAAQGSAINWLDQNAANFGYRRVGNAWVHEGG